MPRLPPELAAGPIVLSSAVAADIFVISQTIFRLVTGKPHSGSSHRMDDLPEVSNETWEPFLDAGLRVRPERRPRTLSELAELMTCSLQLTKGASPVALHVRSERTTGTFSPPFTPKKERNKGGRGRRTLLILGAGIALIVGLMVVKQNLFRNGGGGLFSSECTRGFGDTILQYPDRSYEGAKWKEVYSNKRMLPDDVEFYHIRGWDRDNFVILAGVASLYGDIVLLTYRDQKWHTSNYTTGGSTSRLSDARFLSADRIIAVFPDEGRDNYLAEIIKSRVVKIAEDIKDENYKIVPISEDAFFGVADSSQYPNWLFQSGQMSTPEENRRNHYIYTSQNTIAQGNYSSELETQSIFTSASIEKGRAIALFSSCDDSGIAEYRNGRWYLVSLTPSLLEKHNREPWIEAEPRPWIDADGNVIATGDKNIVSYINGRTSVESITVSGQPIRSDRIAAIWGHDHDHYWAVDNKGNVYSCVDGNWGLAVRGPKLDEDEYFHDVWPTPEGDLIAITEEKVFRLE